MHRCRASLRMLPSDWNMKIVAAATSTATTAKVTMHMVVEGVRRDIQEQIEQNRTDTLQWEQEARHRVEKIFKQLANFD